MSATAMPLPLELTKPVTLASDLDTQLRENLGLGKYDPKLQISMSYDGGRSNTTSRNNSKTAGLLVSDVIADFQVDDAIDVGL